MIEPEEIDEGFEPAHGFDYFTTLDQVAQAMLHPLRRRAYIEAVRGPVSAKELSGRLGVPLQRMSYHVRLLADEGLLKVVRRTQRRGAIETHYRAVATLEFTNDVLAQASTDSRTSFHLAEVRNITEDLEYAVAEEDVATDEDYILGRAHVVTDAQGAERVYALLAEFYERLRLLELEVRTDAGSEAREINILLGHYRGERRAGRNGPALTGPGDDWDTIPE